MTHLNLILTLENIKKQGKVVEKPETPDELMEFGASEEESGDKFYASDPAKALRFYQRAYEAYIQAGLPETAYNASRLLFHVHSRYSEETVLLQDLTGVQEVFSAYMPVVQELGAIAEAHETALQMQEGLELDSEKCDLFYNAAMVYTEIVEAGEGEGEGQDAEHIIRAFNRASQLLTQVLEFQKGRLSAGDPIQDDFLDTARAAITLVVAALEDGHVNISENGSSSSVSTNVLPFVQYVTSIVSSIDPSNVTSEEFIIARAYLEAATDGCSQDTPDDIFSIWTNPNLPDTPERYMQAADSLESFLFHWNIAPRPGFALSIVDNSAMAEMYWRVLTEMTKHLKSASTGLQTRLSGARNDPQALGVGSIIAQLARVHIARADIDLQRSLLPRNLSTSDRELLTKNCNAFLKNAMNLARGSGGIRETFVERTQRNRRRVEAILRLCILEKRTSQEELDEILGPGKWQDESKNLALLWYWNQVP